MIFKRLLLALLVLGASFSACADPLQFTNVARSLFPGLTNRLNAVAYGGNTNFLAVGGQQLYVFGNFVPSQPLLAGNNWVVNSITNNSTRTGANLDAVVSGANQFVVSGDNNWVFSATNLFSPSGLSWPSNNAKVFNNNAVSAAAAYNGGNFVVVGEAPEIGYTNLPVADDWNLATFADNSLSLFESFRGVTPYGANGFAVCGIFGDVRLSNDGANWQVAVNGQIGQPDFYGIAYDGSRTLVCVGATNATTTADGIIMASTNNGASWLVVFTNDLNNAASAINSVAYTGSGFVAVGDNGQVLTSSNGLAWAVSANIPVSAGVNFYGVAFATSGFLQGVGEIVGDNGNVIITGPPPPANTNLGDKWISVGVTNTLVVTNVWGTNLIRVDWYAGQWPDNNLATNYLGNPATNSFLFTPPAQTINTNATNIYWAQATDLRTGFINTNRTEMILTNFMRPTAAMISTNYIRNGDSTTVQALLTGNGPWTVVWTDGFTFYTNTAGAAGVFNANSPFTTGLVIPNSALNPADQFPNAATNHYYWISKLADADFPAGDPASLNPSGTNWLGDLAGTNLVVVFPRPTATSVTTNTICNAGATTLTNVLTGLGPWTVYWTDGFTNFTQVVNIDAAGPFTNTLTIPNAIFDPTNLFANFSTNHYYWITSVVDSNLLSTFDPSCASLPSDITGTNLVVVNPRPTASLLSFASTDCNEGPVYTLTNRLTGFGPWTVAWNDGYIQTTNGPAGTTVTLLRTVNPTNSFGVNTASNNVFYVANVVDANSCIGNLPGDITGTVTNTINPRPTAALLSFDTTNCNEGPVYTLTNRLTGFGPWTVAWNNGYIQTTNGPRGTTVSCCGR